MDNTTKIFGGLFAVGILILIGTQTAQRKGAGTRRSTLRGLKGKKRRSLKGGKRKKARSPAQKAAFKRMIAARDAKRGY